MLPTDANFSEWTLVTQGLIAAVRIQDMNFIGNALFFYI